MRTFRLSETGERGWFVGDFPRAVWRTPAFEVCYQFSPRGSAGACHTHRVAKELNLVASGRVRANGVEFGPGDLFEVLPGEYLYCEYPEDDRSEVRTLFHGPRTDPTYTVCVKTPSVPGDKYYCTDPSAPDDVTGAVTAGVVSSNASSSSRTSSQCGEPASDAFGNSTGTR